MSEIVVAVLGRIAVALLRRLPFGALAWLEGRAGTSSLWSSIVTTAFVLKGVETSRTRRRDRPAPAPAPASVQD